MTTLTIRIPDNNPAIMQTLDGWSKTGEIIIEESSAGEEFERIPGLPYTREERIASVRRSVAHYRATGDAITSEELRKEMLTW